MKTRKAAASPFAICTHINRPSFELEVYLRFAGAVLPFQWFPKLRTVSSRHVC